MMRLRNSLDHEITHGERVVERVDNRVYLYCEINSANVIAVTKELQIIAHENMQRPDFDGNYAPVWLHINSDGGSLWDAFALADTIKGLGVPVYSVAEGLCASAATIIAAACHKRLSRANAVFLIHQLSGGMWGTFEQMSDQMGMYQSGMKQLVHFYMSHSHLSEQQAKDILSRDTWLLPEQMVEYGLVDKIL